jgi:deferrochelatase/peroxidase EfeB
MMTLTEALKLVLELAEQNQLSDDQCMGDATLLAERKRQDDACELARDFIEKGGPDKWVTMHSKP